MFYYVTEGKQRESLACRDPSLLIPTPLPVLSPHWAAFTCYPAW